MSRAFSIPVVLSLFAAVASLMRGQRYIYEREQRRAEQAAPVALRCSEDEEPG